MVHLKKYMLINFLFVHEEKDWNFFVFDFNLIMLLKRRLTMCEWGKPAGFLHLLTSGQLKEKNVT